MRAARRSGGSTVAADAHEWRKQTIVNLVREASVELSARDRLAEAMCREFLAPGTRIYINFAANDSYHQTVEAAIRLKRAGFVPVPHVAARYLIGFTQLDDLLARLSGEAGVEQVLAIGGDLDQPAGPYHSSLELLETGLFAKRGIRTVGIAGYPEGHLRISEAQLDAALRAKLAIVARDGLTPYIVTQFCFEAAPILSWIDRTRAAGIAAPVRIGLAGPASIATLAKYAVRCGIGHSIRALARGHASLARLLVESGPELLIDQLAAAASPGMAGLHFFAFGGLARTGRWFQAAARGAITFAEGDGFKVNPGGTT